MLKCYRWLIWNDERGFLKLLMGVTSSEVHMVRVLPNHVVAWYGYWFAKEAREEHTVYASSRFSAAFQKELRYPTMRA